jgi:hypothetical protein
MTDSLTRWTVRVALALYVLSLLERASAAGSVRRRSTARLFWTAGCLAYLLHVVCAFQFQHHWSHDAAYEATARQTHEVTGFDWGGGLYVNYVFTLVWLADALRWWGDLDAYEARPPVVNALVQGFMAFIIFNATVVFGTGLIRWAGAAAFVLLLAVFISRVRA